MTHKLRKLVALCLCLILLPTWASAMSWNTFVTNAKQIQTAAGSGQAVIDKDSLGLADDETIEAAELGDEYLELLEALISGLTFEGTLWLTDGFYVLEGVKVNVLGNDSDGIAIKNSEGGLVALLIDETSQIGTAANPMGDYGIQADMDGGALLLENHADIYAQYGIYVDGWGQGDGDVLIDIYNSGTIEAENIGLSLGAYGQNAEMLVVNEGEIRATYAISAYVLAEEDALMALINNGAIEGEDSGLSLGAFGKNAALLVVNDGAITAYSGSGIHADAWADEDALMLLINSGAIEGEDIGAVLNAGGQNADISVVNDGQITASDGQGLVYVVYDHSNTTLSLSGSGAIAGAKLDFFENSLNVYKQNANGVWELQTELADPFDILVEVPDWENALSSAEREALATQIVTDSGILAYQNGHAMVLFTGAGSDGPERAMLEEGSEAMNNLYIFETERPVDPDPVDPDPVDPDPVDPDPVDPDPIDPDPIDPKKEETKKIWKHGKYGNIPYSREWLRQAWLVGGSRDLRVYLPERDEQELLDQGDRLLFKELVSKGPDEAKMLTLTVNEKYTGSMLTCVSMETLRLLVKWGITTLQVVSGDDEGGFHTDIYYLADILAALESLGYDDCQEIWLSGGMDGDAVIINANGEKQAL